MNDYLERSRQLLGEEKINEIANKTICVIGVGGVGGTALESLARSGFKHFVIIDSDVVDISNINRQILFTINDVGKDKVLVAKKRLLNISDDITCETIKCKIGDEPLSNIVKTKVDFVIDAIDYVEGKIQIIEWCLNNKIKFISSLGMGNRLDPEKVMLTRLNKTENDPLARKMRYDIRNKGLDLKLVPVVFSNETPIVKLPKPSSMMMVPSTAGLIITKYVLFTI